MPFHNFMDASHSAKLPSMTSDTRTCAECGKIVVNMHSKTMNSVITHRGDYRAQGLCEPCNIKNDIERLLLKLRTLSKAWEKTAKSNNVGDQCGFDMNDPGPGLLKAIIEYIAGGTDDEEEENRSKLSALHALAGMRGNLRLLTWIFDKLDPAIKSN